MKTKDAYTKVLARFFEVTPEAIEQRFKNTSLYCSPEFDSELSSEQVQRLENLDVQQLRVTLTSILDAVNISVSKIEKIIQKG